MSSNIFAENYTISPAMREEKLGQKGMTIWLFGLSGSGKSTIAENLDQTLFEKGFHCARLDGDNLRTGLCEGLGFSQEDRTENMRRAAHAAKLLNEAGVIVIASFITPLEKDRELVRGILGERLKLVFVDTPLEVCEQRDPKGLYKKAREGKIKDFTGVSAVFERPLGKDVMHLEEDGKHLRRLVSEISNS